MAILGKSRSFPAAVALLAAAMLSGCAAPGYCGRDCVSGDLATRTGHDLGPGSCPFEIALPELANLDDGLSEDEAAAIGLWNNPGFQELLADLYITRADLIQAHQLTNPQLTTMIPTGVKQWELALLVPVDVLVLRPKRVLAAELESQRVAERLVQDGLNVVRDVRLAYVDLRLAEAQARLSQEVRERLAELARIAEARLNRGAASELEIAPIRLEARSWQERAARAAQDEELARQRLRYQLGLALLDDPVQLGPEEEALPPQSVNVEQLVSEAVDSRPDVRAADLAIEAAAQRHRLAYFDYFNIAAILPDLNGKGEKGFEAGPGLQMNLPLFHHNQGAKARTAAEALRLERQLVRMRDSAALEVRQAAIRLAQAEQSHAQWQDEIGPRAKTAADSARKALAEDGTPLLTVLETTRQWQTARQRELETAAEVRRAWAELERSVGRKLRDRQTATAETVP
jgi:cobalt-zinc-cadmium efflux system outer membrane protein